MAINLAGIEMKNPVMVASGTYGYGKEFADYTDLNKLGALVTKTVTLKAREGNPPPRICETPSGMLNTIGLQNPGIEKFLKEAIPFLKKLKIPVIINIAGETIEEFAELAKILEKEKVVKGIEVNVSCPNVKSGGMAFGCDPDLVSKITKSVKKAVSAPVIVKLTPNVTDITLIAKAAEAAGADAITAINTVLGMSFDLKTGKPKLSRGVGGLSGPAIRPIAVRCVWQIAQAVKIPVIGVGGIMTSDDAKEFFLAGAKAVQVGTANFVDTEAAVKVAAGLK
ncbi:MAG: dihydroorotate dehydrogenase [Candidatus Margulisbacteria bacterium]|nr:dihydroorotate dehydrogenase [Candidatus Margulisiibacteriota bacterium]MBU1021211.1 dihydroorotate dehydrogenase [Candidatus Margulisiibacteriota bacterium]MBU1729817.1 dihydroorotate dehydrogenase [Candidatus Margulisiibacteriota bacterium]MBU1955318.1 dihydroorotate dehydrogenase [Candidatus Margulisiibacteriota bacterium]